MALIRLRGLCEAGNVCLTLIQRHRHRRRPTARSPRPRRRGDPQGTRRRGCHTHPAEQVATMLYGLGPDTRTDTPGREVLA